MTRAILSSAAVSPSRASSEACAVASRSSMPSKARASPATSAGPPDETDRVASPAAMAPAVSRSAVMGRDTYVATTMASATVASRARSIQ